MEAYQVTVTKEDSHFFARSEDFGVGVDADSIENAVKSLKKVMEQAGILLLKEGKTLPEGKFITDIPEEGAVVVIMTDIEKEFRNSSSESVRRNISMPAWMDIRLRSYNVDASKLFQEAAEEKIKSLENRNIKIDSVEELRACASEKLIGELMNECKKALNNMILKGE